MYTTGLLLGNVWGGLGYDTQNFSNVLHLSLDNPLFRIIMYGIDEIVIIFITALFCALIHPRF